MSWTLRRATTTPADLEAITGIVNAVTPDEPTSPDELRWADTTYPGGARFIAELDGRPAGATSAGRIWVRPPEFDAWWATMLVLPDARRRGIGDALYTAVSGAAGAAGKIALHVPASEARPDGIAFLERRGFVEYERSKVVRLELAGLEPPVVDPPSGVAVTTLEERPDLVEGVWEVAREALPDVPAGDEPMAAGDLAEFRARDVDRPAIPPGGFAVALEAVGGRVVGYASLYVVSGPGSLAWHDMTAVARDWRRRGVAGALKRATIRWAIEAGLSALETGNDPANAPMRAINARLGFRPRPDEIVMRGPLREAAA